MSIKRSSVTAQYGVAAMTSHIPQQQGNGSLLKTDAGVNPTKAMTVCITAGAGIAPADATTVGKPNITHHFPVSCFWQDLLYPVRISPSISALDSAAISKRLYTAIIYICSRLVM